MINENRYLLYLESDAFISRFERKLHPYINYIFGDIIRHVLLFFTRAPLALREPINKWQIPIRKVIYDAVLINNRQLDIEVELMDQYSYNQDVMDAWFIYDSDVKTDTILDIVSKAYDYVVGIFLLQPEVNTAIRPFCYAASGVTVFRRNTEYMFWLYPSRKDVK